MTTVSIDEREIPRTPTPDLDVAERERPTHVDPGRRAPTVPAGSVEHVRRCLNGAEDALHAWRDLKRRARRPRADAAWPAIREVLLHAAREIPPSIVVAEAAYHSCVRIRDAWATASATPEHGPDLVRGYAAAEVELLDTWRDWRHLSLLAREVADALGPCFAGEILRRITGPNHLPGGA